MYLERKYASKRVKMRRVITLLWPRTQKNSLKTEKTPFIEQKKTTTNKQEK